MVYSLFQMWILRSFPVQHIWKFTWNSCYIVNNLRVIVRYTNFSSYYSALADASLYLLNVIELTTRLIVNSDKDGLDKNPFPEIYYFNDSSISVLMKSGVGWITCARKNRSPKIAQKLFRKKPIDWSNNFYRRIQNSWFQLTIRLVLLQQAP